MSYLRPTLPLRADCRMCNDLEDLPSLSKHTKRSLMPRGNGPPWWMVYFIDQPMLFESAQEDLQEVLAYLETKFPGVSASTLWELEGC
jgi:hypothetical protein